MCHHEIGQFDYERLREATDEYADEHGFEPDEDAEPEEPTVAPADD